MRNPGGNGPPGSIASASAKEGGIEGPSRGPSAEARPFQEKTTASESEGIALLAGPSGRLKTRGWRDICDLRSIPGSPDLLKKSLFSGRII